MLTRTHTPNKRRANPLSAEAEALRALCSGILSEPEWREAVIRLSGYAFKDMSHRLVFEALAEIGTGRAETIRAELPARLTRKGFPAVDHELFFNTANLRIQSAHDVISELLRKGSQRT